MRNPLAGLTPQQIEEARRQAEAFQQMQQGQGTEALSGGGMDPQMMMLMRAGMGMLAGSGKGNSNASVIGQGMLGGMDSYEQSMQRGLMDKRYNKHQDRLDLGEQRAADREKNRLDHEAKMAALAESRETRAKDKSKTEAADASRTAGYHDDLGLATQAIRGGGFEGEELNQYKWQAASALAGLGKTNAMEDMISPTSSKHLTSLQKNIPTVMDAMGTDKKTATQMILFAKDKSPQAQRQYFVSAALRANYGNEEKALKSADVIMRALHPEMYQEEPGAGAGQVRRDPLNFRD